MNQEDQDYPQDQDEYSEDEYDEDEETIFANSSPALLLILAVGGFSLGILMLGITFGSVVTLETYLGSASSIAWLILPSPMLIFGVASIWQYEATWLQRIGAAAIGFAISQYIMLNAAIQNL